MSRFGIKLCYVVRCSGSFIPCVVAASDSSSGAPIQTTNLLNQDIVIGSSSRKQKSNAGLQSEPSSTKDDGTVEQIEEPGTPAERPLIWDRLKRKFLFSVPYDLDAYQDPIQGKDGLEAVKILFSSLTSSSPTLISLECNAVKKSTMIALVFGFVWGNIIGYREGFPEVKSLLAVTRFTTVKHAQQIMYDKTLMIMSLDGVKRAFRLGILVYAYMLTLHTAAAYSGRYTWWNFVAAGALSGSMYRIAVSPMALVGGAIVGGTLGLVQAAVCLPYMYATGKNLPEFREEYRVKIFNQLRKEAERKDYDERRREERNLKTQAQSET